ncbi:hypothetical protein MMALV_00290 [Candidatus Methanomethylophilus alvi Mx1201]|uniref:Uncharacterized protein n=1 Tax=Methanomethylophilus alvi (strain Mx1201) TaxID=1236689 RepID=M9S8S0_METAX|nr:hypothetical protein MMALV_00290 [Candidatus Methanomethylophilus alvi Mx1201]
MERVTVADYIIIGTENRTYKDCILGCARQLFHPGSPWKGHV